jgi:hypothetical protein
LAKKVRTTLNKGSLKEIAAIPEGNGAAEPMIKLQPSGQAAILNYNVPEPTTYNGRNIIELQYPSSYFIQNQRANALKTKFSIMQSTSKISTKELTRTDIIKSMKEGFSDKSLFINNELYEGALRLEEKPDSSYEVVSTEPISPKLAKLNPENVFAAFHAGKKVAIFRSLSGSLTYDFISTAKSDGDIGDIKPGAVTKMLPDGPRPIPEEPFFRLRIISPANGATIPGPSTGVPITVSGTADDAEQIIQKIEVRFPPPNQIIQATPSSPNDWSKWSASGTITTEGPHTITAIGTDINGNAQTSRVTITISFTTSPDVNPPSVKITSPANEDSVSGPPTGVVINVKGTASDPGSGLQQIEVKIGPNSFKIAKPFQVDDWSEWSASDTITTEGLHTITAKATDRAGIPKEDSVTIKVLFVRPPTIGRPRLFLVESYRLSSYLGNYGAGRTIKTLTLLPGEKTKISVRTFMSRIEDAKKASSILDSFTEESASEFQLSIGREQSDKQNYQESMQYEINASANANWGWGSAQISGGVKEGTNSTREEFAKNVSNVTQKHASKASAKRDIKIETSYEVKEERREETTIEQEIENINVSRTLNFVFRQMNQEFITFLHLVDIRIGFFDNVDSNDPSTWKQKEVPLPELDSLLKEFVIDDKREDVREDIINQITSISDYKGDLANGFINKVVLTDSSAPPKEVRKYYRVGRDYITTYLDPTTQTKRDIAGVILSANKYVLRTDAVIVDAILGQGDALDSYSHGLQDEAVRSNRLSNELLEIEIAKSNMAMNIVKDKNSPAGALYAQVFPCCLPRDKEDKDNSTESK